MTGPRDPDARIAAYFQASQPDLPDRTFDAVRGEIHRTRQRVVVGPFRLPGALPGRWATVAAAAALALAVVLLDLRLGGGPFGGPGPTPTPSAAASPSAAATSSGPTHFVSSLYGYSVTVPAGWITAEALLHWDGVKQSGPDAESDRFDGPEQLTVWAFAGPFAGNLDAFTADRIAANGRDHADTCPVAEPEFTEPLPIGAQQWVLVGWNCGAVINMAITVRNGVAYAFTFRDLAVDAASDPADRALFLSILETVELPG